MEEEHKGHKRKPYGKEFKNEPHSIPMYSAAYNPTAQGVPYYQVNQAMMYGQFMMPQQ